MKKGLMLLLFLIVLLMPLTGMAELKNGSKGAAVTELQTRLNDLGFSVGTVDGKYGNKTVQAVKAFQKAMGLNATGKADDDTMDSMAEVWYLAMSTLDAIDILQQKEYSPSCVWMEDGCAPCARHAAAIRGREIAQRKDLPETLKMMLLSASQIRWLNAIDAMYDEWEERLSEGEKPIAGQYKQEFLNALAQNRMTWNAASRDVTVVMRNEAEWLETMGVDLCFDLHGMEPQAVMDTQKGE